MPPANPVDLHAVPGGPGLAVRRRGQGPLLWQLPHWFGSPVHDDDNPVVAPLQRGLAGRHTLLRHELRGCGQATGGGSLPLGFDAWLADTEFLAERVAPPRFALLGQSQGAALAIAYAARHPGRVSHLVLHGGYVRGRLLREPQAADELHTMERLVALGWDRVESSVRQLFTTQLLPGASRRVQASFNDAQRLAVGGSQAARLLRVFESIDISALLARVQCPVLVLHSRGDARVPMSQGLELAAGIAGAEFVPLATDNHLLPEGDPALAAWHDAVQRFLAPAAAGPAHAPTGAERLTPRLRELAELLAQGHGNAQIAQALGLSAKTVRNQMSRLFDDLAVENRGQAVVAARGLGFGLGV